MPGSVMCPVSDMTNKSAGWEDATAAGLAVPLKNWAAQAETKFIFTNPVGRLVAPAEECGTRASESFLVPELLYLTVVAPHRAQRALPHVCRPGRDASARAREL